MWFNNPNRRDAKLAHRLGAALTAAAAGVLLAGQALATDTPGETFLFDWAETSPTLGVTGTVDLTLGSASTMTGYFDVASFAITQKGGFCGVCSPLTENLGGALFDSATGGVVGDVTGSFVNAHGATETFTLLITNLPSGTWTFDQTYPKTGVTTVTKGTYITTEAPTTVDEPGILLLLIPAAGGLAISLRRRRSALTS